MKAYSHSHTVNQSMRSESLAGREYNATHCLRISGGVAVKRIARKSGLALTSYWLLDEL